MYNVWRPGFHEPFPCFDNVDVTPGSGKTFATDTIGGFEHQRVKLIHGIDGVNDGDVATTNGLPVKEVLNTITFSGGVTGSLFEEAATPAFSLELACGSATLVVVRSEFQTTASDSCVVRVWYEDSAGIWSVGGSLYTVNGTAVADGSGPGSAVTLEQTGTWYFGETFTIDVRGWTTICLELTTAPTTAVSMWGEQV